jgi:hypothetical protein
VAILESILSGGQSGVDQAAWRAAKACGIPTGGFMPAGFKTEDGPRPGFAELYNAVEMPTASYPARTEANVRDSDGTIWLGSIDSSGFSATHDAALARGFSYPFLVVFPRITRPSEVAGWITEKNVRTLNVAGNRESVSPGIGERAERFLVAVFRRILRVE